MRTVAVVLLSLATSAAFAPDAMRLGSVHSPRCELECSVLASELCAVARSAGKGYASVAAPTGGDAAMPKIDHLAPYRHVWVQLGTL